MSEPLTAEPEVRASAEAVAAAVPIGFLADHVEILYDLDSEAKTRAGELGIDLHRTTSMNAAPGPIEARSTVTRGVLAT